MGEVARVGGVAGDRRYDRGAEPRGASGQEVTTAAFRLAETPSGLLPALEAARNFAAGPWSYVAGNGESVTVRPDPLRVDPDIANKARDRLAAIRSALGERAPPRLVVWWLLKLSSLVERAPAGEDLQASVKSLAAQVAYPPECFTEATVGMAARRCRWWPGLAKLEEALDPLVADLREEAKLLEAIVASASLRSAAALPAPAPAASRTPESWSREDVEGRVRAIETGARDALTRVAATVLARNIATHAPDLAQEMGNRLRRAIEIPDAAAPDARVGRPRTRLDDLALLGEFQRQLQDPAAAPSVRTRMIALRRQLGLPPLEGTAA